MKYKVEYNPDFFNDIIQAVDWYNEKQNGLGDRLFNNIKKQTAKLSTSANHFVINTMTSGACTLKSFHIWCITV